jgi:protein TonB
VFDRLIESRPTRDRGRAVGGGLVSVVVHAVVIGGAVIATLSVGRVATRAKVDTTMVYLPQQRHEQPKPPEREPVPLGTPLKGFQTVVAPTEIPSNIPPVNLLEKFNPKDYTGIGVEGGVAAGVVPTAGEVYMEAIVEEKPALLSAPEARYPEMLRQAGIQGRVVVEAIIDTSGRAEPNSIRIIRSPNPGFDEPSRYWMQRALFRPARVHGQAVRVLVEVPIDYRIARA